MVVAGGFVVVVVAGGLVVVVVAGAVVVVVAGAVVVVVVPPPLELTLNVNPFTANVSFPPVATTSVPYSNWVGTSVA